MLNNVNSLYDAITQNLRLPYETIECSEKWVAESLADKVNEWVPNLNVYLGRNVPKYPEPILIHAPTGTGKTTFVIDNLVEFARSQNQWVLILSNRLALNMQYKQALNKKFNLNVGTRMLEDITTFNNVITLCTYQSFLSFLGSNPNLSSPLFIVCDEAHFFCTDAVFNAWTEEILKSIVYHFPESCRIFMSATPEDVKPVIAAAEYLLWQGKHSLFDNLDIRNHAKRSIKEYCFQSDYKNIEISFFCKWDTIVNAISNQGKQSKWLIFVSSISKGEELKKQLTSNIADFIDSSVKSEDDNKIQELARRHRFDKKVLICTSVLDNGVSLIDEDLKEIVVDFTDFVEVIQAIGRKRISEGEKVHIHVHIPKLETIHEYIQTNNHLYNTINHFDKNPREFYNNWGRLSVAEQKLFRFISVPNGSVFPASNSLAKYQFGLKSYQFEKLYDEMKVDADTYAKQICTLFGKEFSDNMNEDGLKQDEVISGLTKILYQYVGKELSPTDDLPIIDKRLQEYWETHKLPSIKISLKAAEEGKPRHAEHIKCFIEKLHLPFLPPKKSNNYYSITMSTESTLENDETYTD